MSQDRNCHPRLDELLSVKRWEVPPPSHFELQASQIMSRVEAEDIRLRHSWAGRLGGILEPDSLLACIYSVAVVLLLVVGVHTARSIKSDRSTRHDLSTEQLTPLTGDQGLERFTRQPIGFQSVYQREEGFTPSIQPVIGTLRHRAPSALPFGASSASIVTVGYGSHSPSAR